MNSLMPTYGRQPITLQYGRGATVWDDTGREYLDLLAGIAVCSLGHANPAVTQALSRQAARLVHCSNLYRIREQEELGDRLTQLAGMDRVFFANSGAEANEAAIKIARRHGRERGIETPQIVVTDTAFHGRTLATLTATGNTRIQDGFGPLLPGFIVVPFDDPAAIESLATKRGDIAAVMVEPLQGEGGVRVPADSYLPALRALCDRHDWLLMLDEIQSGMGRTGHWFAHQALGIRPDVMSLAKALGNGVPIGACLARGPAADYLDPGSHGSTFGGNPLACSAALAVIREIEERHLVKRAAALGKRFSEGLSRRLHNQPGVRDIRGRGLMIGIELDRPCKELVGEALEAGVLLNVTAGNVVRLLPPLILTDAEADRAVGLVSELICALLSRSQTDSPASDSEQSTDALRA